MGPFLADRLRLATRTLHAEAERSGVMAALLQGRLDRGTYCALLRNLHAIYAALESALGAALRAADPLIAALEVPPLFREAALAADLDALQGRDWRAQGAIEPAAQHYVERLRTLAAAGSRALVAHAYVRYLGDLHGGQVLKRLVARQFGLAEGAGTSFYDFGSDEAALALRQGFRAALAALRPSAEDGALIVGEACWAFEQHKLLFVQLQRHAAPAL